ncbi:CDP-paratose 2-epimerase [Candidatus Roizmanbacteria bacterium RIFCSPHIGHO2_12_FULL_33_9]|uniref:CDP-paratose 2-epimerase n=1 Tax=Candidatus Roizmanbacteria bacterium RIFCSPHIGHO2_12_FULL_33_9 TaxID=1802045 RepID=A0A1F7HEU4_9BACT|nr:MAG: CDP-paratose 2-epimerase [Candidatus Roizmanbacteria bacterium RIFCSPHIGHO2_12_FULL_33_9]
MKILITGGAGFIGVNTAVHFLRKGHAVSIYDNLSRKNVKNNLAFLIKNFPKTEILKRDVRDFESLSKAVEGKDVVFHFAGQVAVTSSVENPREDFDNNALGTLNLLESVRLSKSKPIILYSSTNKAYGGLEDLKIIEKKTRYAFKDLPLGISENRNLDFHSPYGCSKGAADQYVRDYARIYGLKTVVFRQSCIYGPHQYGVEDQGWLAWFIIALHLGKKLTIYGNGKQVRDVLFIQDLIDAFELAIKNINRTKGKIYNIGGGFSNSISVWLEFGPMLEKLMKKKINVNFANWRPGDQRIFISDIRKAKKDFGWEPSTSIYEGLKMLYDWVRKNMG